MLGTCERWRNAALFYAIISRVILFTVQLILSSLDFSTDAFKGPRDHPEFWLCRLFRGFTRWDALQFTQIAEHGYVYEHSLAFFPLFPTLIRAGANLLHTVSLESIAIPTGIVVAGVSLNAVTFLISTLLIHDVSLIVTSSEKISRIATLLFIVNPASIFFSSVYTESLYCCLSLAGIRLLLSSSYLRLPLTTLLFSCAYLTRSNGLLNIGYLLFYEGLTLIGTQRDRLWNRSIFVQFIKIGGYIARTGLALAVIVLAVRIHSYRQVDRFCSRASPVLVSRSLIEFGQRENLTIVGSPVAWCRESSMFSPPFYSTVQKQWDVGLFGYWKIQKIPCFLLAAPALLLTAYCAVRVFKRLCHNGAEWLLDARGDSLPFALHSIALAIPALLIYNVEVFTRIVFSSSPFLYIELARTIDERTPGVAAEHLTKPSLFPFVPYLMYRKDICRTIAVYFVAYYFLGTAMHAAFLPFT